jgi:DNA topoisomerase-1
MKIMRHDGVVLPKFVFQNIQCKYAGNVLKLNALAETYVLTFLKLKKYHDKTFVRNFLSTFSKYVGVNGGDADIKLWDFSKFKDKKIARARCVNSEGNATHEAKKYTYNPRIEPPTVFVGRGLHPKRGSVKPPLRKKDITLNAQGVPNSGEWAAVVNVNAPWVAKYKDTLSGEQKYVFLNEHNDDENKFNNARNLRRKLPVLRKRYNADMRSNDVSSRQCATCLAIIDALCIRVGNEKDADTADTVGCCTLNRKHVKLNDGIITFSFIGKDSIPCLKRLKNSTVYENMRGMLKSKKGNDLVFDITPNVLNRYINSIVPGATAKTFRTCHASKLMEENLRKGNTMTCFKESNEKVAKLLCHVKGDSLSCGTSKMNYIDPRIIFSWCERNDVPVWKVYSSALQVRHSWASGLDKNFVY